jgi:hypothetical protein
MNKGTTCEAELANQTNALQLVGVRQEIVETQLVLPYFYVMVIKLVTQKVSATKLNVTFCIQFTVQYNNYRTVNMIPNLH